MGVKPFTSNQHQERIESRDMPRSRDSCVLAPSLSTAAAFHVSLAAAETLLAIAFVAILVTRPERIVWPTYLVPLCAFMATTVAALLMSPQPEVGMSAVRKFVL